MKFSIRTFITIPLTFVLYSCQNSANAQLETAGKNPANNTVVKEEPHQYGGWYCPDNFGFVPVDIQKLDKVPAIADRLPTKQELENHMSLIDVDVTKHPDARAFKMDLPRVASVYNHNIGKKELVIVIQAIVVQTDTVVGYRFVNGGNGSDRINKVTFLTKDEVANMGSQPFYYSQTVLKASPKDIWNAMRKTDYFVRLGNKFNKQQFFTSEWNPKAEASLKNETKGEKAAGYVGMVFGNYYLHIDYDRDGLHYSEKILMLENAEDHTTKFFYASGPYPKDFEKRKGELDNWVEGVKKAAEAQ